MKRFLGLLTVLVAVSIFAYGKIAQGKPVGEDRLMFSCYIIDGQEAYVFEEGPISPEAYDLFFDSDKKNSHLYRFKYNELKLVEVFMKNDLSDRNHYIIFTPKKGNPETVSVVDYIVFIKKDFSRRTDKFISESSQANYKKIKIADRTQLAVYR